MEEDWEILELTGPFNAYSVHNPTGSLVYALGTVVVIWDATCDKKINLRSHTSPVTSISFSTDNEYFLTVECSLQPLICLWNWKSLEQLSAKWLPFKPRTQNLYNVYSSFGLRKALVCEVETDGGYRITVWGLEGGELELKLVEELELHEDCRSICILNDQINFACLEPLCLKIWNIDSCSITKRFHFKTQVRALEYCKSQGFFALLLENKTILLLNQSGKTLALLSSPVYSFTGVCSCLDYLYVSTSEGNVVIYNLRSYKVFKELPQTHSSSIKGLKVSTNSLIYVIFEDATVQVLNLSEGQVANQSSGHCLAINTAVWAEKLNFFSSSDEGCLYVWKYVGKGWNMQAMDISGGKGDITALSVHPTHRILACGFSKGSVKIFQTGDKPKFLHIIQLESSKIVSLEYSFCGKYLGTLHESGYAVLLNSKFEISAELELSRPKPCLFLCLHEIFSSSGVYILSGTMKEHNIINLQVFKNNKDDLEKTDEKTMEIDGTGTGIKFHCSGNYLLCTSDLGGIYLFSVETGEVSGVITAEKGAIGCILDPSGLYVGVFAESYVGMHNRFVLYEIGTGRKASELGRLDKMVSNAAKISSDGKYLLIGGSSGILAVWRLPKALINTVHDMLASMQSNPYIWLEYPIDLPNKEITGHNKRSKELLISYNQDNTKQKGAFADSVVFLVKKPEKINKERAASRPGRVSRINIPENTQSKTNSRSDTPLMSNKDHKITLKPKINDFYFKKPPVLSKHAGKTPTIIKSSLISASKSIESIDVECNAPSHNPAHRLYEKYESNRSEGTDF
jgi:WD40 repeat protein